MCMKTIRIIIISAFLVLCMPIIACAAPDFNGENTQETEKLSFFEEFQLDEAEFIYNETEDNMDSHPMTDLYIDLNKEITNTDKEDSDVVKKEINSFSYLKLNKGFDVKDSHGNALKLDSNFINVAPTFSSTKKISGNGEEGVTVGIMVYDSWTEEGKLNITYQSEYQTIGLSKIFDETIELNTIGINYICIAVMKDEDTEYRVYVLNRKEEETREKLENIEIEFKVNDDTEQDSDEKVEEESVEDSAFDLFKNFSSDLTN
ncbi:hypothetical protein [Vallitalea guaymasensis]|uniref:Uncharacterized protein n=1 Tax=Vallitalea guaymasensis TaxID=1185412 RepID=A0A8J8MA32_9FIRM|nr:hypothetical protein [Vallitalea guaymasensis]QUH29144.1 hypothetical protein HYG85_09495 [Vallitalea guaymasensis]